MDSLAPVDVGAVMPIAAVPATTVSPVLELERDKVAKGAV